MLPFRNLQEKGFSEWYGLGARGGGGGGLEPYFIFWRNSGTKFDGSSILGCLNMSYTPRHTDLELCHRHYSLIVLS